MIRELSPADMDDLLDRELVGRIGCCADDLVYVVPVNFAHVNGHIYGQTVEGMKVQIMRKNPRVCFEVDSLRGIFDWASVILWGTFRELEGDEAERARSLLLQKLRRFAAVHESRQLLEERFLRAPYIEGRTPVVFAIDVSERTGRCEQR